MPLPTTQPVDWPDWGAVPTFTTQIINVVSVLAPGQVLAEIPAGYYSHVLVVLQADGDGSDWTVDLAWYTATASEGGSLIGSVRTTRVWPGTVVIPMTAWAPVLRISDVSASVYPHNFIATVTLFSDRGFMTGYPGGITVINEFNVVAGLTAHTFDGLACGPGLHTVNLQTDSPNWNLSLTTYYDESNSRSVLLADETTPTPYNIAFHPPASSFELVFQNEDAGDCDLNLTVIRDPL